MIVRVLTLCLLVFGTAFAEKESVYDDESFNQLTEDLIKEIRKRISDDAVPGGSLDECREDFDLTKQKNTIIMTHDSLENGAEFVLAPTVNSGPECQAKCCDEENCNVAVFKFKEDEKSCYLFDCGNPGTCLFANHTGFTVTSLPKKKTAKVLGKNHEEDLVKLATTTAATTTTLQPTTTTTEKEEKKEDDKNKKPPVSLFGECEKDKDCAGSKTVCQVNYCVCQDGYHAQDGECKAPNSDETQDAAPPKSVETPNGPAGGRSGWDNNDSKEKHKNEGKDSGQKTGDGWDDNDSDEKHRNDHEKNDSDPKHQPGYDGDDNDSAEKHKDDDSSSSEGKKSDDNDSEEKHRNDDHDKNDSDPKHQPGYDGDDNDSAEKHRKGDDNDSAEKHKNKSDDNDSDEKHKKGDDDDSDEKHRDSTVSKSGTGVRVEKPQGDLQVNKEELDSAKETEANQSNQGAVIALALGLSITALLLVFVGCRLRNVKRRLRRGRPLNSNEADYLVNGMYL